MSNPNSVVTELLQIFPNWHPQMYFKSSLTALSHAMEDMVLAGDESPLVIASFQQERFYRQEAHRYKKLVNALLTFMYLLPQKLNLVIALIFTKKLLFLLMML